MNRLRQSDIHPGADSLSAFVEKALPEAERARIESDNKWRDLSVSTDFAVKA